MLSYKGLIDVIFKLHDSRKTAILIKPRDVLDYNKREKQFNSMLLRSMHGLLSILIHVYLAVKKLE